MYIEIKQIIKHPYDLTLQLTETELAELQDTLQTVSIAKQQFSESQRDQAREISERISAIWEE
jgi:hypothetical protein